MIGQRGRMALIFAIVAAIVVLGGVGGGVLLYGRTQLEPVSATHDGAVSINIAAGEGIDGVAADLSDHGLIKSKFWFGMFARIKGLGDQLHPGRFNLDPGMGASAIIAKLEGGPDAAARRLVFAEGLTLDQMANKVAAAGLGITRDQYLQSAKTDQFNAPFLNARAAGETSLEGFLFPDTYDVPEHARAHDIIQMQLDDFAHKALPSLSKDAPYSDLVIASIVEREARFADDQPKVAAVIRNRLAIGMRLQVDATVVYGLNKVGQQMSSADAQTDTPYNTYLHTGLPPTPISNPGIATIQASVNPAASDYLFYVTDGCGHNHYSKTVSEHDALVNQYLGKPCTP